MTVKKVMEGVWQRTGCQELEGLALQAADDPLYQTILGAIREERLVTDFPPDHGVRALSGVWEEMGIEDTHSGPLVTVDGKLLVPHEARKSALEKFHMKLP